MGRGKCHKNNFVAFLAIQINKNETHVVYCGGLTARPRATLPALPAREEPPLPPLGQPGRRPKGDEAPASCSRAAHQKAHIATGGAHAIDPLYSCW